MNNRNTKKNKSPGGFLRYAGRHPLAAATAALVWLAAFLVLTVLVFLVGFIVIKGVRHLTPELFSEGLNRDIFIEIVECYKGGESSAEHYLLNKFEHREEELAAVIIKSDDPDNRLAAARDYIDVIRSEDLKERIAEAEKSGDMVLLAQLIKNKHRKAGT